MIWTQPCTSPAMLFQLLQSWSLLEFGQWCQATMCWISISYLFGAVKILNEGDTIGWIAWRWFEVNPASQGGLFQLLWWSLLQFGTFFSCFGQWKYWIKMLPKGKLSQDDMKSTQHQSKRVYFNFCNGSCRNFDNDAKQHCKLSKDDMKSTQHQFKRVYFNFCNGSCRNFDNDAKQHCAGAAFFSCFGQWKYWIKVLPKGKLQEDDLMSTLHQSRQVNFNFCNGSSWNWANEAKPFLSVLGSENTE